MLYRIEITDSMGFVAAVGDEANTGIYRFTCSASIIAPFLPGCLHLPRLVPVFAPVAPRE